jgi:hypothetical protein
MGAGRPEPGTGQHQVCLGGDRQITDRRRLHHRLQKLAEALQKVSLPRQRVRRKILRNKHPPGYHRCQIM